MEGLEVNPGWWRGRRVFVTGHTGFKGAWLSLWLQRLGADVTGYSLAPPSQPNLFETADVARGMRSISGDVRDASRVAAALSDARSSVVFHLAAQSLVRTSYLEPLATYETNVIGTGNVLQAIAGDAGVRAAVMVTSDKCYAPAPDARRHREDDALGGNSPYAASKAAAELVTSGYRGVLAAAASVAVVATARAGNVIGGGDWARDRLVPDVISAFIARKPARVRNPKAVRPWQHVLDPLEGYLTLAERLCEEGAPFAEAWNFGPAEDHERPVGALADFLAERWGDGASWQHSDDGGTGLREEPELRLDSSKAAQRLGWRAHIPLEPALGSVVEWHKSQRAGANPRDLVEADIERLRVAAVP
ncbi:MAG TPA: CDP-glucose 4,6-dehydratase [Candidatus Tumulicola sp.]|nr:CDP-glucose 4,6-dehydratase [Candidatus Tumulicola sp.]